MKHSSGSESRRETRPLDIILDLSPRQESYSYSNRRATSTKTQRLYPWLLLASTTIAGVFCFAYITKPVIAIYPSDSKISSESKPAVLSDPSKKAGGSNAANSGNPVANRIQALPQAPVTSGFEETNIRMQHILDAESSSGDIHRIIIDVPALYQSRQLRWSQEDAAQARLLLQRLEAYQEKSRNLRDEGEIILQDWNKLMDASVPNQILRADSPSVSSNLLKSSQLNQKPEPDAVKIQSP